jgi:hypothetical protein
MTGAAEQLSWQCRAHAVLGRLLDLAGAGDLLPAADWTVASHGCQVTGRFTSPSPPARRRALEAWAEALGVHVARGVSPAGRVTLSAMTRSREDNVVRIVLTADIWEDRAEGGASDG